MSITPIGAYRLRLEAGSWNLCYEVHSNRSSRAARLLTCQKHGHFSGLRDVHRWIIERDEHVSASASALDLSLELLHLLDHRRPSDTLALCRYERSISHNGLTRVPSVARCSTNRMCDYRGFGERNTISLPMFPCLVSYRRPQDHEGVPWARVRDCPKVPPH